MTRDELISILQSFPNAEIFVDDGGLVFDITNVELVKDGVEVIVFHIKEA